MIENSYYLSLCAGMLDGWSIRVVERRKLRNVSIPLWLKYGGGADCQHSQSRGAANRELPEQPDAGTRVELLLCYSYRTYYITALEPLDAQEMKDRL